MDWVCCPKLELSGNLSLEAFSFSFSISWLECLFKADFGDSEKVGGGGTTVAFLKVATIGFLVTKFVFEGCGGESAMLLENNGTTGLTGLICGRERGSNSNLSSATTCGSSFEGEEEDLMTLIILRGRGLFIISSMCEVEQGHPGLGT